jgi:predicted RNA-binding Zn-ribbon protein involved in translation (DUF1610 family)
MHDQKHHGVGQTEAAAAAASEARRRAEAIAAARDEFFRTPAGQARIAFERGDQVFQYAHNVMSQQAIIVAMVGSTTATKTADPSVILNSVCNEGWELVTGSFVFVEQGQQSRDKFMSSGQNVAIQGTTVGYYLFKRCEANKRDLGQPWEQDVQEFSCPQCQEIVTRDHSACPSCGKRFAWADLGA